MKRYLDLYRHILLFNLQSKLEYRLNFFLQLLYGPAYVLVLFLIIQVVYHNTQTLAGWTKTETLLIFSVLHLMYSVCIFLFLGGYRHFLWEGVRTGEIDLYLVKPINTQFMVAFSRPEIQQIGLIVGLLLLFISQVSQLLPQTTLLSWCFFLVGILGAFGIVYLTLGTYLTVGFYVTKAAQILEIFDKTSDFAQYPTSIFPAPIQLISFTIIPIAFFSYVPTSLLLQKLPATWLLYSLLLLILLIFIHKWSWSKALKAYSSASS